MPSESFRVGVATVSIPTKTNTVLPSIAAVTVTAASTVLEDYLIQDIRAPLDITATYQFILALRGYDLDNKGYTVGAGTVATTAVQCASAGYGILLTVSNASWPAGFTQAISADVFMKKNNGNYQLVESAIIDPVNDFNHMILSEPLLVSTTYTAALLNSTTSDPNLGNRKPTGIILNALTPTTGGVDVERTIDVATLSPDNGPNFPVPVTRSTILRFQLLANDIKNVVQAWAGNYAKYLSAGHEYEEAQMSILAAQALITENAPIVLTMPINKFGKQEIRLYTSMFIQNLAAWTEAWRKDAQTPVTIQFNTIGLDTLSLNSPAEIVLRKNS